MNALPKTTRTLSLRANFSWIFVGNVVYAASQWGILIAIARLGTEEMLGLFALGLAISAPIIQFTNLGLRQVLATDVREVYVIGDYLSLRLFMTMLALLLIIVISVTLYDVEALQIIVFISIAKVFEALSDVAYGFLQQQERMDYIGKAQLIKGPASLVSMIIGILLTNSLAGGVIGMLLVWCILFITFDLHNMRRLVSHQEQMMPRWDLERLKPLLWTALPMGFVALLGSLGWSLPRIFIEQFLGEAQLGIFAALFYLLVAGSTIVVALGQSAAPRMAQYRAIGNWQAYTRLLLQLTGIGLAIGLIGLIGAIFFGQQVLGLIYGPTYATYTDLFVLLMVVGLITYVDTCIGYAITAARIFRLQILSSGIPALITYGLCLFFLPSGTLFTVAWIIIGAVSASLLIKLTMIGWIFIRR
ncbi:MAG: oligosaccharide flippase family protein [Chloroflexota bacterium]